MNLQDRVSRLEALLGRIQRNAALPRTAPINLAPAVPVAAPVPSAPEPEELSDVDELLASPASQPVPVVEEPIPYTPAVAETPALEVPVEIEEEPIPLVAVSAQRESTAPTEEIYEEDIVELSAPEAIEEVEPVEEEVRAASGDADLDYEEEEEQPPVSSQRAKVGMGSIDEALAAAAEQLDDEREVPIKTPPPESGPQEAAVPMPPGIHAPPAPDVDDLLRAEAPSGGYSGRPTTEQLGDTIDLDEGGASALELDEPMVSHVQVHARGGDDLEMPLPSRESGGMYDESLTPPPNAREDLEAVRVRERERELQVPPESISQSPYSQRGAAFARPAEPAVTTESPVAAVSTVTVGQMDVSAPSEIVARPELNVPAARFQGGIEFKPATFIELLDASLSLGSE